MIKFYFELLKPAVIAAAAAKEFGLGELQNVELDELCADLFAYTDNQPQSAGSVLFAVERRLHIVFPSDDSTLASTDLTLAELKTVTVDGLEEEFIRGNDRMVLNHVNQLMKFLTLRWLRRYRSKFMLTRKIWNLHWTFYHVYADAQFDKYRPQIGEAWCKILERLETWDEEDLSVIESLEVMVSAIPDKVVHRVIGETPMMSGCPTGCQDASIDWDKQ